MEFTVTVYVDDQTISVRCSEKHATALIHDFASGFARSSAGVLAPKSEFVIIRGLTETRIIRTAFIQQVVVQ